MAKEIEIPGDDVKSLGNLLGQVLDRIDRKDPLALDERAVGEPMVDAANEFDDRWNDGRKNLRRQCEQLKQACDQIMKAFEDADKETADTLKGDGQQG
ncbi:hypothetical protein [Streptomyces sp. NPDC053427]|uniref:hypothetical protein n=1 Tax=Streptomyces sp. NPDC053427 TaxID=3365701 RepID=UPI0037D4689F